MKWSEEDLAALLKEGRCKVHGDKPATAPEEKKSKYHNQKVKVDGLLFDSRKEAKYYNSLKLLLLAKEIITFSRQVELILQEGFADQKPITYKADFLVVEKTGHCFFVDVKGMKTDVYKMKKKMLLAKYPGIDFREA